MSLARSVSNITAFINEASGDEQHDEICKSVSNFDFDTKSVGSYIEI